MKYTPNRAVWKFPLGLKEGKDIISIEMPAGANILSCQWQHQDLHLWAEVECMADKVKRTFAVVGTGCPMPVAFMNFIATVQDDIGFVWHVYEVKS